MKHALGLLALLLATGCGADTGDTAHDPGGGDRAVSDTPVSDAPASGGPVPDDATTPSSHPSLDPVPGADGRMRTRTLATVLDTGVPELCLGPVAESYPPQCSGIPLIGWDWSRQPASSVETSGSVRWGQYVVTGTFDGLAMTVTGATTELRLPPDALEPTGDAGSWEPGQQQEIQDKLAAHPLPGTLAVHATPSVVVVEVVHDDGSIQAQADEAYGAGLVQVRSMLVPVDR
jgi:hypothetical protein